MDAVGKGYGLLETMVSMGLWGAAHGMSLWLALILGFEIIRVKCRDQVR